MTNHNQKCMPKRIILVRHGESEGNLDGTAYTITPDYKIPLTKLGIQQSKIAGEKIRRVISDEDRQLNWKVYFYVSPYERTRSTLREIGRSFSRESVIGAREEVRVREQDFGNFQVAERMKAIKETRERYGRFFYRFPEGESAADVFDRVSSFLESLWRDIDMNRLHHNPADDLNLIIVSHGLASRVFLMKWFKWTVEQFEYLSNPGNAEFRVMQLGHGGDYSLAIHHSEEQMVEWGLSPEMIADQQFRAQACRGSWNEKCSWYFDSFFNNLDQESAGDLDGTEEEEKTDKEIENGPDDEVENRLDEEDPESRPDVEDPENRPDEEAEIRPDEEDPENRLEEEAENRPDEEAEIRPDEEDPENRPEEEAENRPDEEDQENKADEEVLENGPDEGLENKADEEDLENKADEEDQENKPDEEDLENKPDEDVLESTPDEELEKNPDEEVEELDNRTDGEVENTDE